MKNRPTTQKSIAQKLVAKRIYTLKVALTLTLTFLLALILSCASTNNVKNNSPVSPTSPTRITVPRRSSKTFFAPINQEAMLLAEEGSPQSIRKAIALVRKADRNYTDQEKVFLIMLDSIMKIVWPSERIDWDVPIYDGQTPYTGAIDSAKKGIYDLSTGNTDFFTLLLPSLVLLFTEDVNRFAQVSEQALQTSLIMHKNSSLALYLLGVLYQKTHQYEGALNCFYEASTLSPLCLESACAHTEVLLELGEYEKAYEKSRSLFSDNQNLTVIKLCAESAFALKKYDEAEEYATLVLEKSPNDLDFILFRAKIFYEKGDYIRASSLLDSYARQETLSLEYLLLRSELQFTWSKNISGAINTLETALQYYPHDKNILLMAAKISSSTGSFISGRMAEQFAEEVLLLEPGNLNAKRYKITGLVNNSKWNEAYTQSKELYSITNEQTDLVTHINICLEANRMDEAWNLMLPLYREKQHDEQITQLYITVLYKTGRTNQALTLINNLLPSASSSMKSFLYYRRSFMNQNQEAALADLRSSLISNARNADSLFRMYQIYYDKKDYRRAQYYLKQVVSLQPNNATLQKLNDELTDYLSR